MDVSELHQGSTITGHFKGISSARQRDQKKGKRKTGNDTLKRSHPRRGERTGIGQMEGVKRRKEEKKKRKNTTNNNRSETVSANSLPRQETYQRLNDYYYQSDCQMRKKSSFFVSSGAYLSSVGYSKRTVLRTAAFQQMICFLKVHMWSSFFSFGLSSAPSVHHCVF